jgi:hypothetical protein
MNLTKCAIERIIDQADLHIDSASKNIGSYHMMQHINNLPSSSSKNEDDEDVYDEDVYNEDVYDEDDENKDDTAIFLINSTDIKVP